MIVYAVPVAIIPEFTTPTDLKRTWIKIGILAECDTDAGEKYMQNSPGKGLNLEQCKKSCEDATGCQSIVYVTNGWCSHYSTPCTTTKFHRKATAFSLRTNSVTTAKPITPQPTIDKSTITTAKRAVTTTQVQGTT